MPPTGQRPTYFVPADFDNPPPPVGPIKLGQLIAAPEKPGRPVDPSGPEPFDGYPGMEKFTNSTKFVLERSNSIKSELGLFGRAFQGFGARLGLNFSHEAVSYVLNEIEKLDVEYIEPTDDYIKASMERQKVKDTLKKKWGRKRLFMITGIKSAYPGAKLESIKASSTDTSIDIEGSGPVGGGSVGGGGHGAVSTSASQALFLIPAEPFVYGYRLQECYYTYISRSLKDKEKLDGALFGLGSEDKTAESNDDATEETEDVDEDGFIEFEGIEEDDLDGWDSKSCEYEFEVLSLSDEQGGSSCDAVIPKAKKLLF